MTNYELSDVIAFATQKHKPQTRKFNGEPYITHPLRVAEIVKKFTTDLTLISVAILHDTLEDTNTTYEEIKDKFGIKVANMVYTLTNDKDQLKILGKGEYLLQKINNMKSAELLVKLADRLDNVSDLSLDNENWSRQYATQTDYILSNLNNPNINNNHLVIINQIKSKIFPFL